MFIIYDKTLNLINLFLVIFFICKGLQNNLCACAVHWAFSRLAVSSAFGANLLVAILI